MIEQKNKAQEENKNSKVKETEPKNTEKQWQQLRLHPRSPLTHILTLFLSPMLLLFLSLNNKFSHNYTNIIAICIAKMINDQASRSSSIQLSIKSQDYVMTWKTVLLETVIHLRR